jgi:hypothetical protein
MQFKRFATKRVFVISSVVLSALIAEFFILEGTVGISLPSDRHSALSSVEFKVKGMEQHVIMRNKRFTAVDILTPHGSGREALVLRESFFVDLEEGIEGPAEAMVTVEALDGENVRWRFQEPGESGEVVAGNLYRVKRAGCCDAPTTYAYFSLADGRKIRTDEHELSGDELETLGRSIGK